MMSTPLSTNKKTRKRPRPLALNAPAKTSRPLAGAGFLEKALL